MSRKGTKPPAKAEPRAADKLDAAGIDALCDAIVSGTSMTEYAVQLGVSIGSLINWIEGDSERSARVREARRQSARTYDDKALAELEDAKNAFGLAKAREKAQHYRWRASKIAPKEYGEKLAVGGADDLPPIRQSLDLTGLSAAELATMGELLAKAKAE